MSSDQAQQLQAQVQSAVAEHRMLQIIGGNSKAFYGNTVRGDILETRIHHGIISYEPTELVLTARAGTSLQAIEAALQQHNQMLAFEPPHFGEHATLGGAIACGLSGPRRPFAGAARDFVLGVKILTGKGEIMSFGGQVMKNVAGYDVSRLMVGALGTLGVLLEVSVKVVPRPTIEVTQTLQLNQADAIATMLSLGKRATPLSAALYDGDQLYLRLSGTPSAVKKAQQQLGGEALLHGDKFWRQINEHRYSFFNKSGNLWRLSVPFNAQLDIRGTRLIDWAGAQHWIFSDETADNIRHKAIQAGGHATLFRSNTDGIERFQHLAGGIRHLHVKLKMKFDPYGVLNYGRLYEDL